MIYAEVIDIKQYLPYVYYIHLYGCTLNVNDRGYNISIYQILLSILKNVCHVIFDALMWVISHI